MSSTTTNRNKIQQEPPAAPGNESEAAHADHTPLWKLSLAALGVVYGDIGTSPLYTIKEVFNPAHGLVRDHDTILGILSILFWSLTLIVSVKYLLLVLRADNRGDGGVFALLALVLIPGTRGAATLATLGLIGAGLLLADGCITPAISVLGATEGLVIASPAFSHLVVPLTVVVLVLLFSLQRKGTAGIGAIFGPIMFVWFGVLVLIGLPWILKHPSVMAALNPIYAVNFFVDHRFAGFLILGSIVLCITGAEALYADMGHFGKQPIRLAWYVFVGPALLVNYFGQGAYMLSHGNEASHPFFSLVPGNFVLPLVVLSTMAAVIASQAMISGSFSLAQQAVQLGYLPRLTVVHTSATIRGQIYVPQVNWMLMVMCLGLVLAMRSTAGLAGAYGLAVVGTMTITTMLLYSVARHRWNWSRARAIPLILLFLSVELAYLISSTAKIQQGGWFPLASGIGLYLIMSTWKRGRKVLYTRLQSSTYPIEKLLEELEHEKVVRVPGTAVFLTSGAEGVPLVLLHHFKHNKVFHEKVVLLTVETEMVPRVRGKLSVEDLGQGFYRVVSRHGFMEQPSVPKILMACQPFGLKIHPLDASYYLGRVTLIPSGHTRMAGWRKRIFIFLSRNARTATAYFGIPANRVVELGAQVEI